MGQYTTKKSIDRNFRAMKSVRFARQVERRAPPYIPSLRSLHSSAPRRATPIPHPPTPGPPPKPPTPVSSAPDERVERKRKQAELLRIGQNLRAESTKGSIVLSKRFWKNVTVKETSEGFHIMLDARPVRTSSKNILVIPSTKPHLASAIALEWDLLVSAQQATKNHYIPLTSLTARALDIQTADVASNTALRESIVKSLIEYLQTDTLLCWAPEKNLYEGENKPAGSGRHGGSLRQLQVNTATPIMEFLTKHVWPGIDIQPVLGEDSIMPSPQPQATTETIQKWAMELPAFELAATERAVLASKSLLIAARLLVDWSSAFGDTLGQAANRAKFTTEDAAVACSLEVLWQTGMWGEVEDTHDVEKEDVRRQLGSVVLLVQSLSSSPRSQ